MNALFSIGQRVVCVNSKDSTLVDGKTYIICAHDFCPHCGHVVVDVGVRGAPSTKRECVNCKGQRENRLGDANLYKETRFIPIDTNQQLEDEIFEALKEDLKVKNFQDSKSQPESESNVFVHSKYQA